MPAFRFSRLALVSGAAATGAFVLGVTGASAQILGSPDEGALARTGLFTRDQNVSVLERPRPEYAPLGVHVNDFTLSPELDTSLEYNTNIYAVPNDTQSDEIFHISPALTATSTWSRNQLQLFGRGSFNEYVDHSSESTQNGAVGGNFRYDIADNVGANFGASVERNTESRTDPNSPGANVTPIAYTLENAFAGAAVQLTRIRLSARFDIQNFDYDNGTTNTGAIYYQKDRDYTVESGTFRAEYALIPGASVFANLVVNNQDNYNLIAGDISRNNSGYEITAGTNFDVTHLIRGEVFIGYLDQTFEASAYKEISGISARGYLQYFPTQLLTLTLSGTRVPVDSDITGVGAYLDSNVSLRADYELLRNLLLTGSVTYEADSYPDNLRTDNRNFETFSATYLVNRRVGVSLTYQHIQDQSSGGLGGLSFDISSLTAGLTLRY